MVTWDVYFSNSERLGHLEKAQIASEIGKMSFLVQDLPVKCAGRDFRVDFASTVLSPNPLPCGPGHTEQGLALFAQSCFGGVQKL